MKDPRLEHFALECLKLLTTSTKLTLHDGTGAPIMTDNVLTHYSVAAVSFAKALIAALDAEERPSGYRETGR